MPARFRDGFHLSAIAVYRALATESVLKCNAYSYANRPQTKKSDIGLHTRWRSGRRMRRTLGGNPGQVAFQIPSRSSVSDDTQFTLATCESIIENGAVHAERLASHFATWFATGRVSGIGASTLKSMRDLAAGVHWALAGSRGEYSAGNGAAMRIAPLAFLLDPATPADRRVIRDVCRITHHNDEAYVGALAVVIAIRFILSGVWSHENSL